MKKDSCPVVEVGKNNTLVVQRRGRHTNVIARPSREVMEGAAYFAKMQYGEASQTYQSIARQMER